MVSVRSDQMIWKFTEKYMNIKLDGFKKSIVNKKVAVVGLGISNRPLIKYLYKIGVRNIVGFDKAKTDSKEAMNIKEELGEYLKQCFLGDNYLLEFSGMKFDYIFKTPVIRYDIPELVKAKEYGAVITSEMEVFMELCPAMLIAVTGSDGKTTTSTLIYKLLKQEGYKSWLGGNIGKPLLENIEQMREKDMVVLELSSFQLHTMSVSPRIAVVTNVSPNHLDVHKSYAEYIEAKSNIFSHQKASAGDVAVLNYDNVVTSEYAKIVPGAYRYFSRKDEPDTGMYIKDNFLTYRKSSEDECKVLNVDNILLPGNHNIENYMAAISAVIDYVSVETINKVAKSFAGVEHRLELVKTFKGVRYFNSSIDSSPTRTKAALKTFKDKIILIAGGKDKGISYDEIGAPIIDKVKILILIGPTAKNIEDAVYKEAEKRDIKVLDQLEIIHCTSYEEVINTAYNKAVRGDNVLLSPASTSFDMFKNFEERGATFKKLVKELK